MASSRKPQGIRTISSRDSACRERRVVVASLRHRGWSNQNIAGYLHLPVHLVTQDVHKLIAAGEVKSQRYSWKNLKAPRIKAIVSGMKLHLSLRQLVGHVFEKTKEHISYEMIRKIIKSLKKEYGARLFTLA